MSAEIIFVYFFDPMANSGNIGYERELVRVDVNSLIIYEKEL